MKYFGEYNKNLRQLDLFKIFTFLLIIVNFSLTYTLIDNSKKEKIIITPPVITNSFENIGNTFNFAYFEQVGKHLADSLLTISPYNIDRTFDSIQGYFSSEPDEAKAIKDFLLEEAQRIKKDNIYQAFYPLKTIVNNKGNKFAVEGLLKTMTGNVAMEESKKTIEFSYIVTNKKIVIKSFEVK